MAKITKRQKKFAASGGLKNAIKKRRQVKQQHRTKPKDARPEKKKQPTVQTDKNVGYSKHLMRAFCVLSTLVSFFTRALPCGL